MILGSKKLPTHGGLSEVLDLENLMRRFVVFGSICLCRKYIHNFNQRTFESIKIKHEIRSECRSEGTHLKQVTAVYQKNSEISSKGNSEGSVSSRVAIISWLNDNI